MLNGGYVISPKFLRYQETNLLMRKSLLPKWVFNYMATIRDIGTLVLEADSSRSSDRRWTLPDRT